MAQNLVANLPGHVPLFLDGDWNAEADSLALVNFRDLAKLPELAGWRIVHAAGRRAIIGWLEGIGRAPGMDHDAHVTWVLPL
jgi:hypothetical protein